MTQPRLEVRHASKTFTGVKVLDDANFVVQPGEIHGLVGQNGSGKSTLIKLISGVYKPDHGMEVIVDGEHVGPPMHPERLHNAGIAFVHQDLGLIPDLTVRENVRVGRFTTKTTIVPVGWVDKKADRHAVRQTFEFLGFDIDPEDIVQELSPSQQAAVAVARGLQDRAMGSGVIVFDESTRAIPHESLPAFYDMVRMLAAQGTSVVLVSHNLKEILHLTDAVTVMRNGQVVESAVPTATLDEASLTRMVLGREIATQDLMAEFPTPAKPEVFVQINYVGSINFKRIDLMIGKGEIVGITGTTDSGMSDIPRVVTGGFFGWGQLKVGTDVIDVLKSKPKDFIKAGVVLIPENRAYQGLAFGMTVEENVTLPHLKTKGKSWWMGRRWRQDEVKSVLKEYDVRPADPSAAVATFSGGNQQKILFGKWLLSQPRFVAIAEPTQAVDVGARAQLLRSIRELAAGGTSVLVASAEVDDLAAICDRVLIVDKGRLIAQVSAPMTPDKILTRMFPERGDQ